MKLDDLLRQLTTLPEESEVVVNIGGDELDILTVTGLDTPATDGRTAVLSVDRGDLHHHLQTKVSG